MPLPGEGEEAAVYRFRVAACGLAEVVALDVLGRERLTREHERPCDGLQASGNLFDVAIGLKESGVGFPQPSPWSIPVLFARLETERDEAFLSFLADAYVYWSAATFGLSSAEVRGKGRHFCRENLASMVVSAGQQVRL